MITLAAPWCLALLPLPVVVRWLLPGYTEERDALQAPFLDRLAAALGVQPDRGQPAHRRGLAQATLFVLSWLLVVGALARPQWIGAPLTRPLPTRDLLLAVDLSGSMEAQDFTSATGERIDRLSAVKEVLRDFLDHRDGDRVGLVFFGSAAFVQAPFTRDTDTCKLLLDEAQVRMAGPRTVIGDAIGLAITMFEDSELEQRVMILLTDGNDTGSRVPPDKAARVAHDRGITIHTVAVGDPSAAGEEQLDEEALRTVARTTGGAYAHAADRDELEAVYARLDELDTREIETESHRPRRELYSWPLGALLVVTMAFVAITRLAARGGSVRSSAAEIGERK